MLVSAKPVCQSFAKCLREEENCHGPYARCDAGDEQKAMLRIRLAVVGDEIDVPKSLDDGMACRFDVDRAVLLDVRVGIRRGRAVERPDHRGLDRDQVRRGCGRGLVIVR